LPQQDINGAGSFLDTTRGAKGKPTNLVWWCQMAPQLPMRKPGATSWQNPNGCCDAGGPFKTTRQANPGTE